MEVGPVEEEFECGLVEGREIGRLGREADFGGQAFAIFVFGQLRQVELAAFRGLDARGLGLGRRGAGVDVGRVVGDCGFGELFLRHFVGDVGA